MQRNSFAIRMAALAAALSPFLILTVQGGAGYCYFAVFAAGLLWLRDAANRQTGWRLLVEYKWYVLAMTAYPLAVLLQQVIGGYVLPRALDAPARLFLILPGFLLLSAVPASQLRAVQIGCALGAVSAACWSVLVLVSPADWVISGRAGNPFTNPIPFGDTAILLAFMSAAPRREGSAPTWERALRLFGLACGLFASFVSGSRGGWIAVPIMLWLLTMHLRRQHNVSPGLRISVIVIMTLGLTGIASTPMFHERMNAAISDFDKMAHGDASTSIGMRVQLWEASWTLFTEHPVLGVGRGRLEASLQEMADQGRISAQIVNAHAHNEIFSTMAEMGSIGLIALFLLYFGSSYYFWRHRRSSDPPTATAATMGLVMTFGTIVFGLTIDVFTLIMNAAFYALTTATLLGIIANRRATLAAKDASSGAEHSSPLSMKGNSPT